MGARPGVSNQLRLVGGEHGGRKLRFPDVRGLRPTGDRTRETLFNWLAPVIQGSHCLDLYAGSGALGFEAASRGAASVIMVEQHPQAVRQLQDNVQLLGLQDHVQVIRDRSPGWLDKTAMHFDIVFLDPPFADDLLADSIRALDARDVVGEGSLIYVERDRSQALPELPSGWTVFRDKCQGQVAFSLLKVENR